MAKVDMRFGIPVATDYPADEAGGDEFSCQISVDFIAVSANTRSYKHFRQFRIGSHKLKFSYRLACDIKQCPFPSGMHGGYGRNVGRIDQYRHAVGGSYADIQIRQPGDKSVGVGEAGLGFYSTCRDIG